MNVGRKPFAELIAKTRSAEERLIGFGALLRHETRAKVEIVGGSAAPRHLPSDSACDPQRVRTPQGPAAPEV
jgi:hypothetical protein